MQRLEWLKGEQCCLRNGRSCPYALRRRNALLPAQTRGSQCRRLSYNAEYSKLIDRVLSTETIEQPYSSLELASLLLPVILPMMASILMSSCKMSGCKGTERGPFTLSRVHAAAASAVRLPPLGPPLEFAHTTTRLTHFHSHRGCMATYLHLRLPLRNLPPPCQEAAMTAGSKSPARSRRTQASAIPASPANTA